MEMFAGERQVNFADVLEIDEDSFAHRVKSVLERLTVVLRESFEQCLPHGVPQRAELGVLLRVEPIGINDDGEDAVAFFLQGRVWVFLEVLKSGVARFKDKQVLYACAHLGSVASSTQERGALLLSGAREGGRVRLATVG